MERVEHRLTRDHSPLILRRSTMHGLPQIKHLNYSNSFAQKQREETAKDKAREEASRIEYDDETGHGISEEDTIVSDQVE